jgi:hypothetical protein
MANRRTIRTVEERLRPSSIRNLYLGVDPGQSGGIAVVWKGGAEAYKMPDTERDIFDLFKILAPEVSFAIIEHVHSMPRQGVASSFKFGMSYGGLRMAMVGTGLRFEKCSPIKWMNELSCRTGGDKNISKAKAQELFPDIKVTHAIADALLLAEYARRTSPT